jgi:hypothetical protein
MEHFIVQTPLSQPAESRKNEKDIEKLKLIVVRIESATRGG